MSWTGRLLGVDPGATAPGPMADYWYNDVGTASAAGLLVTTDAAR